MAKSPVILGRLEKQLYQEANALFKTDEYKKFFGTKLTKSDFNKMKPCEGSQVCAYAWQHAADRLPWLGAAALLGGLEIANADGIIKGGGMSHRMAHKLQDELGIPISRQPSNKDHMEVEDEHAHFLMIVAKRHMKTKDDFDTIMHGARTTWAINKTWLRLMTVEMEALRN